MTTCNVTEVTQSDKPTENYNLSAVPLSFSECFSFFQLILGFVLDFKDK